MSNEQIKIIFYTNLPNQDKIEFKRSLLYHPDLKESSLRLEEYPYFTDLVEYPLNKLKRLSYSEMVDFFFNKQQFNRLLMGQKKLSTDSSSQNTYANSNIKTMFTLLFPTGFPLDNDYHTSYELVNGIKTNDSFFKNPFSSSRFSYLRLNNGVYTVKTTIWLNDILNHPNYKELVDTTHSLFDTIKTKTEEIQAVQEQIMQEIQETISDIMEKIYKGVVLSASKLKSGSPIQFGIDTGSLYKDLLNLQYNILVSRGAAKADVIEIQKQFLLKHVKNETRSDEIIEMFSTIIEDSEKSDFHNSFVEQQEKSIMPIIDSLSQLKSFITISGSFPKQVTNIIPEINEKIDKITNQKASIMAQLETYKKLSKILTGEPTSALFDVDTRIQQKFNSFKYAMRNFQYPNRESSNIYLQNLITLKNDEAMRKFFRFFNKLYDYFIDNGGDKLTDTEKHLMNIGVSSINADSRDLPHKEICVVVDFIEGEVNNQNKRSIFCPYTSEHLGNQFENLTDRREKTNLLWSVEDDRILFKVKDLSMENKEKAHPQLELQEKNVGNYRKEKVDTGELSSWLLTYVIPTTETVLNQIFSKISGIRNEPLSKEDLLPFLMKHNAELYSFLNEMMAKKDKYSISTEKRLLELDGKYNTKLKQNETELTIKSSYLDANEKEKIKLLADIEEQKLYITVVKYLLDFERKKQKSKGGKKKTMKYKYFYGRTTRRGKL